MLNKIHSLYKLFLGYVLGPFFRVVMLLIPVTDHVLFSFAIAFYTLVFENHDYTLYSHKIKTKLARENPFPGANKIIRIT